MNSLAPSTAGEDAVSAQLFANLPLGETTSPPAAQNEEITADQVKAIIENDEDDDDEEENDDDNSQTETATKLSELELMSQIPTLVKDFMNRVANKTTFIDRMVYSFKERNIEKLNDVDNLMEMLPKRLRETVVSEMLDCGYIDLLGEMVNLLDKGKPLANKFALMRKACIIYGLLTTITDCSTRACMVLMAKGFVGVLIRNISNDEYRDDLEEDDMNGCFVTLNLCNIHNIAKVPDSHETFHEVNGVEALQYFLGSDCEKIQMSSLSALACILNDSEISMTCLDKHRVISKLVECLGKALDHEDHNYNGFQADELVESLSSLAVCDHNKRTIAKSGAIPLLMKMTQSTEETEQQLAFNCLWTLAFDEDIRKEILATEGCIEHLEKMHATTTNREARIRARHGLDYIKMGKTGLAEMRSLHSKKFSSSDADATALSEANDQSKNAGHVFISYSWRNQEVVLRIRDFLIQNGFEVWVDVDRMQGSTLEAMADAVENACLVLLCYSEAYRHSNNCRAEAEYVFNLQKPFIPLNMQYRYQPTGWLGIILGSKLYVDFSLEEQSFENSAQKLLSQFNIFCKLNREVITSQVSPAPVTSSRLSTTNSGSATSSFGSNPPGIPEEQLAPVVLSQTLLQSLISANSMAEKRENNLKHIKTWTIQDCHVWLKSEKLEHLCKNPQFSRFDGRALFGLAQMKSSAPHFYYRQMLGLFDKSLLDCLQLSAALDTLMSDTNVKTCNKSNDEELFTCSL